MNRLCCAADMIEAQLWADVLKQAGIEVRVLNQFAAGALGEIPFTHAYPELWLSDARDYEHASALLQALQVRSDARKPCRACGEELDANLLSCWNCNALQ